MRQAGNGSGRIVAERLAGLAAAVRDRVRITGQCDQQVLDATVQGDRGRRLGEVALDGDKARLV
jgi:hypothetical protein